MQTAIDETCLTIERRLPFALLGSNRCKQGAGGRRHPFTDEHDALCEGGGTLLVLSHLGERRFKPSGDLPSLQRILESCPLEKRSGHCCRLGITIQILTRHHHQKCYKVGWAWKSVSGSGFSPANLLARGRFVPFLDLEPVRGYER